MNSTEFVAIDLAARLALVRQRDVLFLLQPSTLIRSLLVTVVHTVVDLMATGVHLVPLDAHGG